jgi:acetyl esterase/lipase/fucose 4-O-acetylase-like acetyltransferase
VRIEQSTIPVLGSSVKPHVRSRNAAIDTFRGVLTILVILGHFSELVQHDSFLTWFGTGFRMPLFMGLSGYLFNLDQVRATAIESLARKYYRRLILPWLIACALVIVVTGSSKWYTPFFTIIHPPFHLWFVPVLICFITIARLCRLDRATMLTLAIPASILAMYIFGVGHQFREIDPMVPDRRFFIFPIYFTYGMWIAQVKPTILNSRFSCLVAATGAVWWGVLYYYPSPNGEVAAELILSVPLISLLPRLGSVAINLPVVAHIGRDSLFFYLWHPLAFGLCIVAGLHGWPLLAVSLLTLLVAWRILAQQSVISELVGILPGASFLGKLPDHSASGVHSDEGIMISIALRLARTGALTTAWIVIVPCMALLLSVLVPIVPWLRIYASSVVPRFASWIFIASLSALFIALLCYALGHSRIARATIEVTALSTLVAAWVVLNLLYVAETNGAKIDFVAVLSMDTISEGGPDVSRIYARPGGDAQWLDLYLPPVRSSLASPVIIEVHGGGFVEGSRAIGAANMRWFADRGWTVVSVDYRLASADRSTSDLATADVECAMVWVRSHAGELNIDLNRLVLSGSSAGGSLAMDAAYATNAGLATPSCSGPLPRVAAVIAQAPLVDAIAAWNYSGEWQEKQHFYLTSYFGGSPAQYPERYKDFDFRHRLHPSNPPTLILGGSQDPLISPNGSEILARNAVHSGLEMRRIMFPYSGHNFNARANSITNQAVVQIIRDYIIEHGAGPVAAPVA